MIPAMRPHLATFVLLCALIARQAPLRAQAPETFAPGAPTPAPASAKPKPVDDADAMAGDTSKFLGKDVPFLSPGTEILSWDGKHWSIADNRLFEARFEKYLNAPEQTAATDREYQGLIQQVLDTLAPNQTTSRALTIAFEILLKAARYPDDARLCDALANAVHSALTAQQNHALLAAANAALERERKVLEWNLKMVASPKPLAAEAAPASAGGKSGKSGKGGSSSAGSTGLLSQQDYEVQPYATRLVELLAAVKANQAKRELGELQAKIEFQALLVQFFFQRRFQHVIMGTRFYRGVFLDGETTLHLDGDAKDLFAKTTGLPPTVGLLDSLASEALRDAREGVDSFKFLLAQKELEGATKRLAEAFIIGEHLPELRTLPRELKRQVLLFSQKTQQLISAIEVKDFALAERLLGELRPLAKDFDDSKAQAAIETSRTVSAMHLAKAKTAAASGDRDTLQTELVAAAKLWPRNPALKEVSSLIFDQADVQQQALVDLDRLASQRNFRQIFDERVRFIAATALYPDRQDKLRQILEQMQGVEAAIIRANEIAKRGDYAGAWESVERAHLACPDDAKLNQLRADLTTQAAEFVKSLRQAKQLEERGELGSSVAWYLRARRLYAPSEFAREGLDRLVPKILPPG